MHVEVNVALNVLVSYLYNKLPRRRVDLFREELEKGLKQKFRDHWYPDKPFKGSGFRCVRCNGEEADPVIMAAAWSAGLELQEVKGHIPKELTLWIDPSDVSYRLNEKSPIKVLYADLKEDEVCDNIEQEVQVASNTSKPDAASFQPIDPLSFYLTSLQLSPSSVSPGTWGSSVIPALLSPSRPMLPSPPAAFMQPSSVPLFMGKTSPPQFTAASFAATKFGSTKLKSQAKRPSRISPTELGSFIRRQQHSSFNSMDSCPQRPRSLSSPDPRLEFMMDQQQHFCIHSQLSPQVHHSVGHTLHQQHLPFPPSPLAPGSSLAADMIRHSPPHMSPQGTTVFPDMLYPESHSPGSMSAIQFPLNFLSPEGHKSFMDDLQQLYKMDGYPSYHQQLLLAN
ncbi:protein Tob1-like [Babylonia areolata]|uniref:protein Tob1-like n=1 Tax=Babylonia areolata TaxID=304850 RepID=UPI003FD004D9